MKYYHNDQPNIKGPRINESITHRETLLINENGEKIGNISIKTALEMARNSKMDLVEVSSNPAVCKIMDYGKMIYEKKKKDKKNENKNKLDIKEIRMNVSIEKHDLSIKAKKAKEFLEKGYKVKVQVKFKGREVAHTELGFQLINNFLNIIGIEFAKFERNPVKDGKFINTMIIRK